MSAPAQHRLSCGIDFGTSNTTMAHVAPSGPALIALEPGHEALPSAVFFGHEKADTFLIGREAIAAYVDGAPGRLMRALKSILGHALVDEPTPVFRRKISFASVIAEFLTEIKTRAERQLQGSIDSVVMGRPVQFVENDSAANAAAENTLRGIAEGIGFKSVSFQFEPVAAAFAFERQLSTEKLALIADIGGGTSDFSVVRLGPDRENRTREQDVLGNAGLRLGGTDFDRSLSMAQFMPTFGLGTRLKSKNLEMPQAPFWDLSTWSNIHNLYEPKFTTLLKSLRFDAQKPQALDRFAFLVQERRCHSLLMEVEDAKIQLSNQPQVEKRLDWIEAGLTISASRQGFEQANRAQGKRLVQAVAACLAQAGTRAADIDAVFFTGGGSMVPWVRAEILSAVPDAEVVDGDRFGAVGLGLGIEASHRYGPGA